MLCFDPCSSLLSFRTVRSEIDRIGLFAQSSDSLAAESPGDDQLDSTDHRTQPAGNSAGSSESHDDIERERSDGRVVVGLHVGTAAHHALSPPGSNEGREEAWTANRT